MLRVASSDGVEIAVHDFGGEGPPVLFSHATGFHAHTFLPMAALLGRHRHCYGLDYRGHGQSSAPASGSFAWRGMADDARAALDGLGLDAPMGVGHSMGGAALLMCELDQPGTFRGLAVFEPIVFSPERVVPSAEQPSPLVEATRRRRQVFASRAEAYENYASKPPLDAFTPEALHAYVDHGFVDQPDGTVRLACAREHEARTFEMSGEHRTYDRLRELRCPVLVLAGEGEGPSDFAEAVAGNIPRGRFHRFEGLGHFGPMEDPARVAAIVEAFFDSLA